MKMFKHFFWVPVLFVSCLCFSVPLIIHAPIAKKEAPPAKAPSTPKKPSKKGFTGPTQPEVQSFKPADANDLVNLFSGDFSYNIPLMDVGGYPVNLFYTSNIAMEDEASWVGLGWNLSPGSINRNVRGLPDDFSGEPIKKSFNIKEHIVLGGTTGADIEYFGLGVNASIGIKSNNYTGVGIDLGAGVSASYSNGNSLSAGVAANLGLSSDAGASISPSVNLSYSIMNEAEKTKTGSIGISAGFKWNSLEGLNSVYIAPSFTRQQSRSTEHPDEQMSATYSTTFPLSYARQTYTPSVTMPMRNTSLSFRIKAGGEVQGVRFAGSLSAFYNSQALDVKQKTNNAYGYMYEHEAADDDQVLHDFNREKDGAFQVNHPDLPVVNATYDVYTVSGQGIAGNFRPFRNDIGTVSDPAISTVSNGMGMGGDGAGGLIAKIGVDIEFTESKTYSGAWTASANESKTFLGFRKKATVNDIRYEPVYFKNVGEKNVLVNKPYYNLIGKREPIALKLEGEGDTKAKSTVVSLANASTALSAANTVKDQREQRNINFQFLTVDEAETMAHERLIKVYSGNGDGDTLLLERAQRNNYTIRGKQMSQIIILKDDGTRYVYGLPAYNFKKQEVSFNISQAINRTMADSSILMQYNANDNSTNNQRGTNNYFNQVETPAYAYAYYLTAVLSPEYADLSGDGPTSDDLGTFTKFTYYRDSLYKWRAPFQRNKAFFNAGNVYDQNDDMGSYQYGEKEVFYLRSIESRNYVAIFECANRKDAHGVLDENGGADLNASLKKLNSISLYTKSGYLKNDRNPVKKINFEYDYALCRNNPSSEADSGKLTLKRLYVTYQRSKKGKKHAYNFSYNGMNPRYNVGASDRWGTYKSVSKIVPGLTEQPRAIANNEFPYTDQENRAIQADPFASAWALTAIQTPTGGTLKVSYEADDYAYVQNKKVMQMLEILGFSTTLTDQPTAAINKFLHIKTTTAVTAATAGELIKNIQEFYFNARINISTAQSATLGTKLFEAVDGFFQLANTTVHVVDPFHIVVEVKPTDNYHPFTLATLKRIKSEYPGVAYKIPDINNNVLNDLGNALQGLIRSAGDLLQGGLLNRLLVEGVAVEIQPGRSFVRMNVANGAKIGGGSRVKKLELSDNWNTMSSNKDSTKSYTIEYAYTQAGENGQVMSSGVASYEPLQGGNENPFLLPEYYNVSKKFSLMGIELFEVENERKYVIGHYGESFFPGANVGYSKVTVKSNPNPQITKHATGKTEYTFYTAYDFPVVYKKTPASVKQFRQFMPIIVYIANTDKVAASQGYYFELNDMHGKPKGVYTFSAKDSINPISGKTFYYKQRNNMLDNTATVIDKFGTISDAEIGIETDVIADERESSTFVKTPSLEVNVDIILIAIYPIPIPVPVPKYSSEDILFRSVCITKVSQRSGLIDSIVSFDGSARFVAKPLLYDAVTGNEVLSAINNEFNERVYTVNIPAHWVHEGMGPAYYNDGLEIASAPMNANGNFEMPKAAQLLFVGDELAVTTNNARERGWVLQINGDEVTVIDATGKKLSNVFNNASLKVIRSGRRNMQSIFVGQLVTKNNPVVGNRLVLDAAKQIINSSAQEYSDKWQTYAAFNIRPSRLVCDCSAAVDTMNRYFASVLLTGIVTGFQQGDSIPGRIYKLSVPQALLLKYFNLNTDSVCYSIEKAKTDITITFLNCSNQDRLCGARLETNALGELQFAGGRIVVYPDNDIVGGESCSDDGFRLAGSNGPTIKGQFECLALRGCRLKYVPVYDADACGVQGDSIVNPFRLGLLGNYKPRKSLLYLTDRTTGHVQQAGGYSQYEPYWSCAAISNAQPANWTWTEQRTKIDPYDRVIETKDTLGRYGAALYGFSNNLVVAAAKNARYQQVAFMSFEDYDFKNTNNSTCWLPKHFDFDGNADSLITGEVSHTGRRSLQLRNNLEYSITRVAPPKVTVPSSINANGEYRMRNQELIGTFSPPEGDYYFEAWVRIPIDTLQSYHGLVEAEVITDLHDTLYFQPFGPVVDGWQKLGGRFYLKSNYNNVKFRFINKAGVTGYIDDIRVHPFDASIETYVYDPTNLRLMATLDDNNFATLYEYDEEGALARVKKETAQGVLTVKEIRSGNPRN